MQISSKSPGEFYKKLEDELNRKLYSLTNSLPFITMAGKALDQHLDMIAVSRKLTVQSLALMDYPSRDDVADIAKRIIRIEERLDGLDECLYLTLVEVEEYRNQIGKFINEICELDI